MKNFFFYLATTLSIVFLFGCGTSKSSYEIYDGPPPPPIGQNATVEERFLDTLVVAAPRTAPQEEEESVSYVLPIYRASHARINNLVHTTLDLRFDWSSQKVIGKATLVLEPFFYPTDSLMLDAKGFTLKSVQLEKKETTTPLEYTYTGQQIDIQLDATYTKGQKYTIVIDYEVIPSSSGGSEAIRSNQGLFFINPTGEDPDKPQQIWTQGETNWNSRWFPTIDHPNERMSQDIFLTVEDRFLTLSNGNMIGSVKNTDGTRTDQWKMEQSHAPYLSMIAVGEFAVVKDQWRDLPLYYYVDPAFESSAKGIFSNTPEMLEFFSSKLDYPFPWEKYAQIVVKDFVSGAMENTSAVVFGDFVQKTNRELIDNHNEDIVSHELSHHWFGDLVTCESWANLTMNEAFATYSEYLWFEHAYGVDEADYHLLADWNNYFNEASLNTHPLIHFEYENNEDMFDRHSYQKGGAVLHMLRNYVGDEAFWASLNHYLKINEYQSVEAHDLRLAFEAITGKDLNWFFNQWFFDEGHPILDITYGYDEEGKQATVTVKQTQDPKEVVPVFEFPVAIDIYFSESDKRREKVWVSQREQVFTFDAPSQPKLVNFDGDRMLLTEREENKSEEEYAFQFEHAPKFMDRYEALLTVAQSESTLTEGLLRKAIKDPFWVIRAIAVDYLDMETADANLVQELNKIASADQHSQVRALALEKLYGSQAPNISATAKTIMQQDSAFIVIGMALQILAEEAPEEALPYAEQYQNEKGNSMKTVVGGVFAANPDKKYFPYFKENIGSIDGPEAIAFATHFQQLAVGLSMDEVTEAASILESNGLDLDDSLWRRAASAKALVDLRNGLLEKAAEVKELMKQEAYQTQAAAVEAQAKKVIENETDPQLTELYQQFKF
ncbi:MAG: M1 family aminopeptidase [Bacteroidota bacterium]